MSSLFPSQFNKIKDYLPTIPEMNLGRFCPSNQHLLYCAVATTALQYIVIDNDVPLVPLISRASTAWLIGLGGFSLLETDLRYFSSAIIINNLVGLFFKTQSSVGASMMFLCFGVAKGIYETEFNKIDKKVTDQQIDKEKTLFSQSKTVEYSSNKLSSNSSKISSDTLPRLIEHLDQQFCIQKKPRDALAKAIISNYNGNKRKKHIALKGSINGGMTTFTKEIARQLNIEIVVINKNTRAYDFRVKTIDDKKQYIILHLLEQEPFEFDDFNSKVLYESSNFLNIFVSTHKNDKGMLPRLSEKVIEFPPLTKEDFKSLLYSKNGNLTSFYELQENLKRKNYILNVDEIPAEIIEKCLQRIIKSSNPFELTVVIKELEAIILRKYSDEDNKTPIPVQLNTLPDDFTPLELTMTGMKAVLDERIVGQDAAKQAIIEAIFFHQHSNDKTAQTKLPKGNVLLIGPSGSGKTFIVETIARSLNIPMASMDLSRVTREGYIGPKISEVFVQLIDSAKGDVERASQGIVFFDEADKIFEDSTNGKNEITGLPIQNQLLCMLQGDTIRVGSNRYDAGGKFLNTENILFIFAGAFHKQTKASDKQLDDEQLIAGGIRPEFLGRIGYISQLSALSQEQIKKILSHGPNAPLTTWKKEFEKFGFRLAMKNETMDQIVLNAMQKETGARGLQYEMRKKLSGLLAAKIMEKESLGEALESNDLKLVEV